jgi:hypothetical protein
MSSEATKVAIGEANGIEDRLAKLRQEKAERDRVWQAKKDAAELQGLELEARFSAELGRMGVDFAMVDATDYEEGFIVVKLGEDLLFRKYVDAVASVEGMVDAADLYNFVAPNVVYPDQATYTQIVRRRGFLANRCADALSALHGVRQKKAVERF